MVKPYVGLLYGTYYFTSTSPQPPLTAHTSRAPPCTRHTYTTITSQRIEMAVSPPNTATLSGLGHRALRPHKKCGITLIARKSLPPLDALDTCRLAVWRPASLRFTAWRSCHANVLFSTCLGSTRSRGSGKAAGGTPASSSCAAAFRDTSSIVHGGNKTASQTDITTKRERERERVENQRAIGSEWDRNRTSQRAHAHARTLFLALEL